ncbi:MAG: NAD(P)-dependent oxidoreductase [Pseudomonadota bacterium]
MTHTIAKTGEPSLTLAVTGASGFVGHAVVDTALAEGHQVTALTRRPQPARDGVSWIEGTLEDTGALDRLMKGVDIVLHIAGAVNVPTREAFAAANIAGTQAVVEAAARAGVKRFIHVSSLAARHPGLSNYGWSKAEAENVVTASALNWSIVRPPAVYGPRDSDMFELFRMARRGVMLLPPKGRTSIIHVDDLARLLIILVMQGAASRIYEPDDGTENGLSHKQLGQAIRTAMGRTNMLSFSAPRPLLHLAAHADRLVRGPRAKLTPDRASYMSHDDWVADPALAPPAGLWSPVIPHAQGLADTAIWYRTQGWFD